MNTVEEDSSPAAEATSAAGLFPRIASWLGSWAAAVVLMLVSRFGKVWSMAGESWIGLLIVFLGFWLGGAVLFIAFSQLDRIRSEGLKFSAQMLLCLLFTILIIAVILVVIS